MLHAQGRILRRQPSVNHVIGYLLSNDLHRVLVFYQHEQRRKIAAKSRLKRNCGHMLRSFSAGGRGCRLQLFKSPSIVHRIIALLGRGKAHIGPYARHVGWLNMAGQKAVNDRQVTCVACRILREDPLARV